MERKPKNQGREAKVTWAWPLLAIHQETAPPSLAIRNLAIRNPDTHSGVHLCVFCRVDAFVMGSWLRECVFLVALMETSRMHKLSAQNDCKSFTKMRKIVSGRPKVFLIAKEGGVYRTMLYLNKFRQTWDSHG